MIDFDKLPKPTTSEAIIFFNQKLYEFKESAKISFFDEIRREKYCEFIRFFEVAYEALRAKEIPDESYNKWISIKERLPEVHSVIAVCMDDNILQAKALATMNKEGLFWNGPNLLNYVTHWMPLPKLPY